MYLCDGSSDAKYTGSSTDGSGVYVSSDRVTHPYKFPLIRKCWYDYFVTNASLYYSGWRKSNGDTFCSGTFTCTVTLLTGTQTCQTRTNEVSIGIGIGAPAIPNKFGLDFKFSLSDQACYTASNTTACQWNDGKCHTVFTSQQLVKQFGYRRQRCNWGNGDETECMADLEIDTPTDYTTYQCGAECGTDDMIIASTSTSSLIPSTTTQSAITQSETSTTTFTFTPSTTSSSTSSTTSSIASSTTSSAATTSLPATVTIGSTSTTLSTASVLSENTKSASTLSTGSKIGVGFETIAFLALFAALGILIWFLKQKKEKKTEERRKRRSRDERNPPDYENMYRT